MKDEIAKLDVGYLALNAGIVQVGLTEQLSDREFESIYNVNALHVVYFTKAMLAQLLARKNRSAIVVVSSVASYFWHADITSYCATKAMVRTFGQALHYEVKAKIDVLAWTPAYILSNMAPTFRERDGILYFRITAAKAVRVMHAALGKTATTCGTLGHRIVMWSATQIIPYRWLMQGKVDRARNLYR